MTINSLENVGIVLADLESAVDFFVDLGLTVDGRTTVEAPGSTAPSASAASVATWPSCTPATGAASSS